MKKNILYVCGLTALLAFVSCNTKAEQKEPLTKKKLLQAFAREAGDSTVKKFSKEVIDSMEMYLDSALVMIHDEYAKTEDLIATKAFCLSMTNELFFKKGGDCDIKRLEEISEKSIRVQFEFLVSENEQQYCLSLANVFLHGHHPDGPLADYFDFYVYLNKKTKECEGIRCILPEIFCNENKKPEVIAFMKESAIGKEAFDLEVSEPEFNKEYGVWEVKIHGDEFKQILQYGSIYLYASENGEEDMESSSINLTCLKKQYKELCNK